MAVIVGVHGIAQQFRGGYELGDVWFNGIRDGLTAAGYPQAAGSLARGDMRVAFFGDLFRTPVLQSGFVTWEQVDPGMSAGCPATCGTATA